MPREPQGEQLFISGTVLRREDAAISTTADADGYTIRVELPAGNMRELGLDIKINDAISPATKTARSASFSQSPIPHLDRFEFNIIDFNRK